MQRSGLAVLPALLSEAAISSCTPSCLCMPLHASTPHAAAPPPSPAPTQPFNSRPALGQRPLIGRPNRSMASQHAVRPWAVEFPGTAIHPHPPRLHTTSYGCVPRAGSGSRHFPSSSPHRRTPRLYPLYHHLGLRTFNQRLFYFLLFWVLIWSNDIDIKCYDTSGIERD